MIYLAIAIGGVLCVLDLLLTFMVIRWARRQFAQLANRGNFFMPSPLPIGSKAPEFEVTTVAGVTRSLADLTGARSAVGFLSVNCGPCRAQLAEFKEYARTVPGGARQVLAVVAGDAERDKDAIAEFIGELDGIASVVVEPVREGAAGKAFSVNRWPTFLVLDEDGKIEAGGPAVRMLSASGRQRQPV
jgi:thiol-disulfide isomerase/thioredoxin